MKPQEPIPHNYSMRTLNLIFALTSLGLLLATGGMVFYDYVRGWKWFQLEFNRLQQDRIDQELSVANDADRQKRIAELDRELRAGQVEVAREREAYLEAQKSLEDWEGKHYAADQDYRFAKALLDAKRYEVEAAIVQHRHDKDEKQRDFDEQGRKVNNLNLRLQQVTRERDAAAARVGKFLARINEVEDRKKEITADIDLLQKQRRTVEMGSNNLILNAPMLDFISPTLKIDQVVLNDLFIDMNYMSVPRVDRCQTCHRAIDRPGFESKKEAERLLTQIRTSLDKNQIQPSRRTEAEERVAALEKIVSAKQEILNPFRTHPKLDTFVGSASPHPLLEYGCTACHRGQDRATEFGRAGHTPASKRMEMRWKEPWPVLTASNLLKPWRLLNGAALADNAAKRNWDYAVNPFLDTPMYPRHHYEAGCVKCHSGQIDVTDGPEISKGMHMVEMLGCHACHKIDNWRFTELQKPGPSLDGLAEKTTPEWTFRWIAAPQRFRSTTRMPAFFYQRNMIGPAVPAHERAQNVKLQDAEIHSIVAYLFAKSTHRNWSAPAAAGNAARGQELVNSIGCMGCHISQETVKDDKGVVRIARRDDFPLERHFGFNLTGVGTKTNPNWVFNWVRNPKAYDKNAPMPSLRLTDQEASDITAYLMSLQKPIFMKDPIRPPDVAAVRELAKGYLVSSLTDADAEAQLRRMPLQEQLVYLGQRSIEKYGCYSCHDISGFEGLKPIGTELTIQGSKNLHLFDFGFFGDSTHTHDYVNWDKKKEHVLHTVPSWIYNKVRSPRVYDDRRTKPYNDKLKMPNFHLSPEEARLVTSVVVGLTKEKIADNRLAASDSRMRQVEQGRKLISQNNCRGCHVVNRRGRAIAPLIADENFLPPDLTPQGERAQSPWLFAFLKDPTVMKIRPWMQVRMPTFQFTDHQASTIVAGFAAEGDEPQFDTHHLAPTEAKNAAIGREVYAMLRCQQCHSTVPVDAADPPVPDTADSTSLAPNLTLSKLRLRHDWIADWIRRPDEMIPGTRMPTNFPRSAETGGFTSPLANAIDTPQFASYKAALLPHFESEEALRKTMGDAVALTNYLRDYIWSVGINQMRAPSTAGPQVTPLLPQPNLTNTPPATPGAQTERTVAAPAQTTARLQQR
ncbi:MAG TPA: c-type cytochrome [Thermoanaerobaculia bacterium]|nr:c-type cytochrome [Thermoanaerobaculia bacterium]